MHGLPSHCKSEGSPGHGQTGEGKFGEGLVRLSVNRVLVTTSCLFVQLFVCLSLTSLLNIWDHITRVPACSSGTLTDVLPHRNAMPQTQDMTSHLVTVYRYGADLSLCYLLMWNVTLEYTATHFNVLGNTRPGNPSPTFQTNFMTLNWSDIYWHINIDRVVTIHNYSRTPLVRPPLMHQKSGILRGVASHQR